MSKPALVYPTTLHIWDDHPDRSREFTNLVLCIDTTINCVALRQYPILDDQSQSYAVCILDESNTELQKVDYCGQSTCLITLRSKEPIEAQFTIIDGRDSRCSFDERVTLDMCCDIAGTKIAINRHIDVVIEDGLLHKSSISALESMYVGYSLARRPIATCTTNDGGRMQLNSTPITLDDDALRFLDAKTESTNSAKCSSTGSKKALSLVMMDSNLTLAKAEFVKPCVKEKDARQSTFSRGTPATATKQPRLPPDPEKVNQDLQTKANSRQEFWNNKYNQEWESRSAYDKMNLIASGRSKDAWGDFSMRNGASGLQRSTHRQQHAALAARGRDGEAAMVTSNTNTSTSTKHASGSDTGGYLIDMTRDYDKPEFETNSPPPAHYRRGRRQPRTQQRGKLTFSPGRSWSTDVTSTASSYSSSLY